MRTHKQEANKIGEVSVISQYPGHARAQYFSPYSKLEDRGVFLSYSKADSSLALYDLAKSLTPWDKYRNQDQDFLALPGETEFRAHDDYYEIPISQLVQTACFDRAVLFADNIASAKSIDLEQLWLRQLLRRLRKAGEREVADRIEYLASEKNAEDGGDIPATASIASFVKFYLDNSDLGSPFLGVTPNGELQAVWMLSDQRRFVAEFLDDDIVKYVYRRSGSMHSSKLFTLGQQPLNKIRGLLKNISI